MCRRILGDADRWRQVEGTCVGDVTGDGIHSGQDIGTLFAAFGSNDSVCDLDGDGSVTSLDFSIMLAAWGSCPQE
jgi:hypothetical protein